METAPVELVVGDIRDGQMLQRLMRRVDAVFHLAALRIVHCAEEPEEGQSVMFSGTYEVFRRAVDAGIKKVVYASSSSVYGQAERFPIEETHHPYGDRTLYGRHH